MMISLSPPTLKHAQQNLLIQLLEKILSLLKKFIAKGQMSTFRSENFSWLDHKHRITQNLPSHLETPQVVHRSDQTSIMNTV